MDDKDFLKTNFTFGLIVMASLNEIQALKEYIVKQGISVVYQKTSSKKCYIKEED